MCTFRATPAAVGEWKKKCGRSNILSELSEPNEKIYLQAFSEDCGSSSKTHFLN
jgi:hypothetical protein